MFEDNHLEYICKLIYDTYLIPIYLLDEHGKIKYEAINNNDFSLYPYQINYLEELFLLDDPNQFPIIRSSKYMEDFIVITLYDGHKFRGKIIVGPTISVQLSEDEIKILMSDLNVKFNDNIVAYYRSLSVHSDLQLINISLQIYYMVYRQILDRAEVLEQNKLLKETEIEIDELKVYMSKNRENENLHHPIYYERKLLEHVKQGQRDEVLKSKKVFIASGRMGVLSKKSYLRSQKNLGITIITLATRAAIDGGLHYELAYTLSDLYIQNIEEIDNMNDLSKFLDEAILEFTDLAKKSNKRYSKPINDCLDYIFSHLYDELNLSTLSEITELHPNYLSTLFHKEVGTPLNTYIQKVKIEEAKTLIQYTKYSLSEVSNLLNFYDQSYFSKTFKKFIGITPSQFKREL
jgi:YesN/AraC family two-component response regulator